MKNTGTVELPRLNFPEYKFTFQTGSAGGQSLKIFDIIRLKYVSLTPEEWVRQHLIHYLVHQCSYPRSLTGVEKQVVVNGMNKRFDLLVYSRSLKPLLLAECKAPDQAVNQAVFDQAARYNRALNAPYLIVSNGLITRLCRVDHDAGSYQFLEQLPQYEELEQN